MFDEVMTLRPEIVSLSQRPGALGKVFWVSGAGSDAVTNSGLDPSAPLATIVRALELCTNEQNDYIYLLTSPADAAFPITINKTTVHLIGVGGPTPHPQVVLNGGGADVLNLRSSGDWCEIANIGFHTTGGGADAMNVLGCFGAWIHHCSFGTSALSEGLTNGIIQTVGGDAIPWCTIEDCLFGNGHAAGVGLTAIAIGGNFIGGYIRRNIFISNGGVCFQASGTEMPKILHNFFYCPIAVGLPDGWAISLLGAGSDGGLIIGNYAGQAGDGAGNNPYRDTTTGFLNTCTNCWAGNYDGPIISPGPAIA